MGKNRRPRPTPPPRQQPPRTGGQEAPGTARRWACDGGEDFTSRGLERQLGIAIIGQLRIIKGCPTKYVVRQPKHGDGLLRGTSSTPNHRLGAKIDVYAWAMANGSPSQQEVPRLILADDFNRQALEGHMLGELMTTSHYQLWAYQVAAARAVALHYGDALIIEKTGRWFRHDAYLLDLVTIDGIPVSPGARPAGRSNPLRTAIANVIYNGRPCPPLPKGWGNPNVATHPFWSNTYNVGAHILRELKRDGDDLGGVTRGEREKPVLRDPMFVRRRGDDYVISIPHFTKSGPGVATFVSRIDDVEVDSPEYRKGQARDWTGPRAAPELADAETVIVPGAKVRPFDMDGEDEE